MESIDIITPGFSLESINESITDSINNVITDNNDYSIFIYISIIFFIGIIIIIIFNFYNNTKKHVSFQEPYEGYKDV